jgi:hypothetical protein
MSVEGTITLGAEDFGRYVTDNWTWSRFALHTNTAYAAEAPRAPRKWREEQDWLYAPIQSGITARRRQEFEYVPPTPPQAPRHDAGYECEPPPDVRAELVKSWRLKIRKRPPERSQWEPRHSMMMFAILMLASGLIANLLHPTRTSAEKQIAPSPQQSVAPISDANTESDSADKLAILHRSEPGATCYPGQAVSGTCAACAT